MKRFSILILISFLLISLQQAIFSRLAIFGISVDLVLIYIVCISLLLDEVEAFGVALITGLLKDSFFPHIFGVNSIIYILISYSYTFIQKKIYKDKNLIPVLFTFIATFFKYVFNFSSYFIVSIKFDFISMMKNNFIKESIFNMIMSLLVYSLVKKIIYHHSFQKEWKF